MGTGFMVQGSGFRVRSGFGVQGSGFTRPRTLNVEHRTLNVEPRTLNPERTMNPEP
jgi:hypothetical protein